MANNPGRAIPSDRVRGFPSADALDAFVLASTYGGNGDPDPDGKDNGSPVKIAPVLAAVVFRRRPGQVAALDFDVLGGEDIRYFRGVFQDPNLFSRLPVQVNVHRETVRELVRDTIGNAAAEAFRHDVVVSEFPHAIVARRSVEGSVAPFFLYAAVLVTFLLQVTEAVREREDGLRQALRTMGLLDSSYWASWAIWHTGFNAASSLSLCALGNAFGFSLFRGNGFGE